MISKNIALIHLRHFLFYAQIAQEHLELGVKYGDKPNTVAMNFINSQIRSLQGLIHEYETEESETSEIA